MTEHEHLRDIANKAAVYLDARDAHRTLRVERSTAVCSQPVMLSYFDYSEPTDCHECRACQLNDRVRRGGHMLGGKLRALRYAVRRWRTQQGGSNDA